MSGRMVIVSVALLIISVTARADNSTRMIVYTFQDGPALLHVGLVDTSPAYGVVLSPSSPPPKKVFKVPLQQFEKIWTMLQSSGAQGFAGGKSANRTFDAVHNYVFPITDKPKRRTTNFVVPKPRASGALISLARQFEAYAR
jgi:hypothetical protein